jgi:hypothetical protein
MVFVAALLTGTSGLMAGQNHVKLPKSMAVAGVLLKAGEYNLQWDLQNQEATVRFLKKGRVVATVQGQVRTEAERKPVDTLYISKDSTGQDIISALGFAGTTQIVTFAVPRLTVRHRTQAFSAWDDSGLFRRSAHPPRPMTD